MGETDLNTLLKLAESDKVGKNAQSVMEAVVEINKALGEFQKTVSMLKNMGVFPLLVRGIGKKLGVDAETPLKTDTGIVPASQQHEQLLRAINVLDEQGLLTVSKKLAAVESRETHATG